MSDTISFGGGSGTVLDAMPMPPASKVLGFAFDSIDTHARTMRVLFTPSDSVLNPTGNIQGGMITAMLDEVMGSMLVILMDGKRVPVTVDLHTQFFRPAPLGSYLGEARVKHMTKSTAFTEATLYNKTDDAVALAVQTHRLLALPQESA